MEEDPAVAAATIGERLEGRLPTAAIVLGSGLGSFVDRLEAPVTIPWRALPGFTPAGVAGHRGELVAGRYRGRAVLCQQGRVHLYEGHPPPAVAFAVRTYAALGIGVLILTNAAGGLRRDLAPGSLLLLADQINLLFRSPLAGRATSNEPRFPDMSEPFDRELRRLAHGVARRERIALEEGVYAGVLGPSYETPAEIRMLRRAGADAVGMSTVPEIIAARARGLRCLGISTITNPAAGLSATRLSHADVIRAGGEAGERLGRLLGGIIDAL